MGRLLKGVFFTLVTLLAAGWHFLDVLGRGEVFMTLPDFAIRLQEFMVKHQDVGYQIAPWVVMFVSVLALTLLQWPNLFRMRPKTIQNSPSAPISHSETPSNTPTYLTAYQMAHYVADESQWGLSKEASNVLLLAPIEFKERASEGRITVYGASSETGLHELIPKTHWMSHGLDLSKLYKPEAISKTVPATYEASLHGTRTGYSDLKIVAADVYRVWPRSDKAKSSAAFDASAFSRDEAIKILWKLRRDGVAIRNEQVASDRQFPAWKAKYEKWRRDVLAVAEKVDENLRQRLEVLNQLRPPPTLPVINQDHALCIAIASEILLRLEERLP